MNVLGVDTANQSDVIQVELPSNSIVCLKMMSFAFKMMNSVLKMMISVFKTRDLARFLLVKSRIFSVLRLFFRLFCDCFVTDLGLFCVPVRVHRLAMGKLFV